MNENMNQDRDLDLFDIIGALVKKWKLILCLTLAVAILAGALGGVLAFTSDDNYGTTVEFYVNSEKTNEYILSLMKSDKFAEAILLDEYGLPKEEKDTPQYNELLAVKKEIEKQKDLIKDIMRENELADYEREVSRLETLYKNANAKYTETHDLLSVYKLAENVTDEQNHNERIKALEAKLDKEAAERDKAKADLDAVSEAKYLAEKKLNMAKIELKNLLEDIEEPLDELLEKFRKQESNVEDLKRVKNFVTYEFVKEMDSTKKEGATDIYSEALLRVNVMVPGDSEFAARITDAIIKKLPEFIEEEVFFDLEYNSDEEMNLECKFISTFSAAEKLDGTSPVKNAILYGAIGGAAVLIITCMGIIISEAFKTKKSNLPVEE